MKETTILADGTPPYFSFSKILLIDGSRSNIQQFLNIQVLHSFSILTQAIILLSIIVM
jgi:hypothetical protein